jgi:HAE1 family hydrophobic/amphiphilic exporter-1
LAVAIFVIPMLSHKLLRVSSKRKRTASLGFDWYHGILDRILIKRWWVIMGALSLILLTLAILPIIGSEFMPQGETNDFQIEVVLDEGTSLEHMDRVATQIEDLVRTLIASRLAGIYTRVGPLAETLSEQTSTDLQDANSAILTVYLNPDLNESTDDIIARIQSALAQNPDWEIRFYREQSSLHETLGTDQAPVVVEVKGEDLHTIRALTEEVKMAMENIKDLVNIESSFEEGRPEINIVFDRIRAGMYNLDFATVGTQLKEQLQGKLVGNWENEGEMRDITVNLPDMSLQQMDDLYIYDGQRKIRLDEIADIQAGIGETEINRRNQVRVGIISAQIRGGEALDQIAAQIKDKLQQINFPQNYSYEISGEELQRQRSFSNLKFALLLSIILIYMVLASQFESLIHPFTILLTIPLAVVGAVLIFFFLQLPLNVMAYIGIILLIGIAVNDSIILVDAINQLRRQGKTLRESILEAGQRRIRPIIMTSLTTILALFPLTLGFGESAALRSPMALAVIGGLVTSTLLTLVVIPCVYYVLDRAATKIKIIP